MASYRWYVHLLRPRAIRRPAARHDRALFPLLFSVATAAKPMRLSVDRPLFDPKTLAIIEREDYDECRYSCSFICPSVQQSFLFILAAVVVRCLFSCHAVPYHLCVFPIFSSAKYCCGASEAVLAGAAFAMTPHLAEIGNGSTTMQSGSAYSTCAVALTRRPPSAFYHHLPFCCCHRHCRHRLWPTVDHLASSCASSCSSLSSSFLFPTLVFRRARAYRTRTTIAIGHGLSRRASIR